MIIDLSKSEIDKFIEFSNKYAKNQEKVEFRQLNTTTRSERRIIRDNLIGKVAEVAVSSMILILRY